MKRKMIVQKKIQEAINLKNNLYRIINYYR